MGERANNRSVTANPEKLLDEITGRFGYTEQEAMSMGLLVLAVGTREGRALASIQLHPDGTPNRMGDVFVLEVHAGRFVDKRP